MKKDEALKYIESKGDTDFIVRTAEEDTMFLENHGKKIEEEKLPSLISDLHKRYDEDIYSVTGLKKNPTEKTYEFTKRVLADYKDRSLRLEDEIGKLKKQVAEGGGAQIQKDLEAVQKQYKDLQEAKDREVASVRKEFDSYRIESEIVAGTTGLQFKKGIPEEATRSLVNQTIKDLTAIASRQDGKLIFMDAEGKPLRNVHNALNFYTADELLKERLKSILDTGEKKPGVDVQKEIIKEYDDKGVIQKVSLLLPDSVTKKEQLGDYLVSMGILRGTPEYRKAYAEYAPKLT